MATGLAMSTCATDRFPPRAESLATLTATQPPGRFGALTLGRADACNTVSGEAGRRRRLDQRRILRPGARGVDYIADDATVWEKDRCKRSRATERSPPISTGFWQPMDTVRDKIVLEELWRQARRRGRSGTTQQKPTRGKLSMSAPRDYSARRSDVTTTVPGQRCRDECAPGGQRRHRVTAARRSPTCSNACRVAVCC